MFLEGKKYLPTKTIRLCIGEARGGGRNQKPQNYYKKVIYFNFYKFYWNVDMKYFFLINQNVNGI